MRPVKKIKKYHIKATVKIRKTKNVKIKTNMTKNLIKTNIEIAANLGH